MHILLSAYACEPGRGSEPAIGWGWALALARAGHRVTVLTRSSNRPAIERADALTGGLPLRFVYCDLPPWARRWKKGRRGVHLYYLLWQWLAYRRARALHGADPFDRVHHVTFVSVRQPSFMGGLGVPFVFGPVAGGERVPRWLLGSLGWRAHAYERWRDALTRLAMRDPLVRRTLRQAVAIYVTSEQTAALIPPRYRRKSRTRLAIGWASWEKDPEPDTEREPPPSDGHFRVLYVGALLMWKGPHLALRAYARAFGSRPDASLTIAGSGLAAAALERLAAELALGDRVRWTGQLPRAKLWRLYRENDVLLFPSLRDSGGMVVLEALAHGVPAICLDLAGPGMIVDETCGVAIAAGDRDEDEIVESLAEALRRLARDPALRDRLARGGRRRVKALTWEGKAAEIEADLRMSAQCSR